MTAVSNSTAEAFRHSLAQAVAWCDPRVDADSPATCLRSAELLAALPESEATSGYWQSVTVINQLVTLRSSFVASEEGRHGQHGRLVCCHVAASEASEASCGESEGYFDEFDVPPWDSWVAWFPHGNSDQSNDGYLIAWVPPALVDLAQRGIDVNPVECIFWADDPAESAWSFRKFCESAPSWYLHSL